MLFEFLFFFSSDFSLRISLILRWWIDDDGILRWDIYRCLIFRYFLYYASSPDVSYSAAIHALYTLIIILSSAIFSVAMVDYVCWLIFRLQYFDFFFFSYFGISTPIYLRLDAGCQPATEESFMPRHFATVGCFEPRLFFDSEFYACRSPEKFESPDTLSDVWYWSALSSHWFFPSSMDTDSCFDSFIVIFRAWASDWLIVIRFRYYDWNIVWYFDTTPRLFQWCPAIQQRL